MFSTQDVRRNVAIDKARNSLNSVIAEDLLNGNIQVRLDFAKTEIWDVGGGALNRNLDCTRCTRTNDCPGDKCIRMS